MKVFSLAVIALSLAVSQINAEVVNLDATADSTIYSNFVDNNGGGHPFAIAGIANNGNERRMLLQFDLSSIAPGSTVNSASLSLSVNQANSGGGGFQLFQLDTAWNEGLQSGNQGSAAAVGEVTWNEAQNSLVDWADGGSFFPSLLSQTAINSTGSFTLGSSANFISAVQSIVDSPGDNNGFILLSTDSGSALRFDTRDQGTPARLTVDFTPVPEPSCIALLGFSASAIAIRRRR